MFTVSAIIESTLVCSIQNFSPNWQPPRFVKRLIGSRLAEILGVRATKMSSHAAEQNANLSKNDDDSSQNMEKITCSKKEEIEQTEELENGENLPGPGENHVIIVSDCDNQWKVLSLLIDRVSVILYLILYIVDVCYLYVSISI